MANQYTHSQAPPQFFVDNKKGEVNELKQLLSQIKTERDQNKRRDVVKKVIAYMTLGVDVSRLFTDMVMISSTSDIVQKKMIFLYLISYANHNQDQAVMVINTFFQDCRRTQADPKIRGLALRSLCSMKFEGAVEYIQPAVEEGLSDPDPYVRRVAVMGVLKLFHFNKSVVEKSNFINSLYELIRDTDSTVSTNAILALNEILADEGGIAINRRIVIYLLNRLHQYNEFSQSVIFDVVARYRSEDEEELLDIMSSLEDKLRHASSSVVLGCAKVFLNFTQNDSSLVQQVFSRLQSILITHYVSAGTSGSQELSYAVLAHILCLIKCGAAETFEQNFKDFFCKYDDPSYIKFMKLEILTLIASENNYHEILSELSASVTDVNAEICKSAIQAIGTIATRVPAASGQIIHQFLGFLNMKIDYVVTKTLVTVKDMMRKYSSVSSEFIPHIASSLDVVNDDEGKAAVIWMLGELGEDIEDAPYILESLVRSTSPKDSLIVAHALLTTSVKLFLKRAPEVQTTLGELFKLIFTDSDDPDLHDRAGFYYKLLQTDPFLAEQIINAPKHPVSNYYEDEAKNFSKTAFEEFNQLSIIYQKPSKKLKKTNEKLIADTDQAPSMGLASQVPQNDEADLLLLEVEGSPPAPPVPSLQANCVMDSEEFQHFWMNLEEDVNITRMIDWVPPLAQMEEMCLPANIFCIASGEQEGFYKFYFYARDMQSFALLSEVNVNCIAREMNIVVKAQEGGEANVFVRALLDVLAPLMQT